MFNRKYIFDSKGGFSIIMLAFGGGGGGELFFSSETCSLQIDFPE